MASVEIRIYTRGLDGFKRAPAGNIVHSTGKRLCVRISRRVLEEALITVPRDNGQLADSGEVVDRENGSAVQFSADYARYVHGPGDGSGRGQRTEPHWPPWGPGTALDAWADRHGIPAFLVARHIARYGTPYVPFLADARRSVVTGEMPQYKREAIGEIRTALREGSDGE